MSYLEAQRVLDFDDVIDNVLDEDNIEELDSSKEKDNLISTQSIQNNKTKNYVWKKR